MNRKCKVCNRIKPLNMFPRCRVGAGELRRRRVGRMEAVLRAASKDYRRYSCKECYGKARYLWFKKSPERVRKHLARGRSMHLQCRLEAIARYGGKCSCCGETALEFLAMDHIDGGGSRHRRSLQWHLYEWLKRQGFPPGFRVLCHNCNLSRGYYGFCPHEIRGAKVAAEVGCHMEEGSSMLKVEHPEGR